MAYLEIGRSAGNPMPVCQGGIMLANALARASLRGRHDEVARMVMSLLDQDGDGGVVASTLTALTNGYRAQLDSRFGFDAAMDYLDGLDQSAKFDAIVNGGDE
ncbi:MAG: hypothetical protein ACKOI2_09720 [Actinomycetota bacterium]